MSNLLNFTAALKSLGGVVLAIVILLAMVTIHEFGHYVAGKILGFRINEFAVGFGPAILKKRSKKTGELFALRVIPLGGFCAFDGEDEYEEEDEAREGEFECLSTDDYFEVDVGDDEEEPFEELSQKNETVPEKTVTEEEYPQPQGARFNDQAPWKRIIVLIAGATMNYLLALILIIVTFACLGRPLYRVQVENPDPEAVQTVDKNTTLQTGDVILAIDGKGTYMITDYIDALDGKKEGDRVSVTVLRDGVKTTAYVVLAKNADFVNMSDTRTLLYSMNIYGLYTQTEKFGFFNSIGDSFVYSFKIGGTVLRSLGELLTGKLGLETMGGPVTTIKVTSEAASNGLASFLNIAAFIGVNLAVFNLLPIPALDGCKVIFCLIEWIRKKPVNRKLETIIHLIGIVAIFGFAILVDVLQWLVF